LAQKISVSLDDISDYNDNLNRIQVLGKQLVEDLKPLIKRIKNNEITPAMLTSDPQINQVAHRYGFGSAAEFMRTKNSVTLPKAYVESFAQATDLSIPQAKIFLYHSFGIKTE
jgi:type II secretory pathway component GspD/PulD (secretin)